MKVIIVVALCLCAFVSAYDLHFDPTLNPGDTYYNSDYSNGVGVSKQVHFSNTIGGIWLEPTNWFESLPRNIDNVFIELNDQTVVTAAHSVIAKSLTISMGNDFEIEDNINVVLSAHAPPCGPGRFVHFDTLECTECPDLHFQEFSDLPFCSSCVANEDGISNADKTACEPCPAGTEFNNDWEETCTALDCTVEDVCLTCPKNTVSNGEGDSCKCCPGGTQTAGEGSSVCERCPDGEDSYTCGDCVPCLPTLRGEACKYTLSPTSAVQTCALNGECIREFYDGDEIFYISGICECYLGFEGPSCQIDSDSNDYTISHIEAGDGFVYTFPFPYESYNLKSRSIPVGPTIGIAPGTFSTDNGIAVRPLGLELDFVSLGYADPTVTLPNDCPECVAQIFGFEILVWVDETNAPIQQDFDGPFWIQVPYDNLPEVVNPNALHAYYYNDFENKWIDVEYTCPTGERTHFIVDDEGAFYIAAYELTAQYHIFLNEAENNWGDDTGTGNGQNDDSTGSGDHRPSTATTGITGLQPAAAPTDPGQATLSPGQNLNQDKESSSASSLVVSIFVLLVVFISMF